ncbi:MAG TPA: NADPH:quinone reductase [Pseudonocardiaceae bacterium]|jgi:NADPH2:quinone reductase|nr:NADPH:quinone reductase [Pseudonocardiaceae bacterium]
MKAIVYAVTGEPGVLRLTERAIPEPGPGEVRVKVTVSAVNPTDWKSRRGDGPGKPVAFPEQVPNQDGAGVVDAVGPDTRLTVGQPVWLWDSAYQRPGGTAQEYLVIPERHAVPLPQGISFDVGADLGVPARTAHRALTIADEGPARLAPGALDGKKVLVAGGAGAVGNAAIQLARWAGAEVLTTISGPEKAELARAAGAHHIINYRTEDAAEAIRAIAPNGVDIIVEVALAANAALDQKVIAPNGTIAAYTTDGGDTVTLDIRPLMFLNTRYHFVLIYTMPEAAKDAAAEDITAALADGAFRVGEDAGLPLHRFPLEKAADAHAAVESGVVGKVVIDLG